MVYLIRRFFSAYFDALVAMIFVLIYHFLSTFFVEEIKMQLEGPSANYWVKLQFIGLFLYYLIFEFFTKKTIGKMIFKFRISGFDESLSLRRFTQVLIRTLSRFIPFDSFSILFDEERIMWHDKLSKTKVVDTRVR